MRHVLHPTSQAGSRSVRCPSRRFMFSICSKKSYMHSPLAICMILLAGCDRPAPLPTEKGVSEFDFNMLKSRVDHIDNQRIEDILFDNRTAYIRPTEKAYAYLQTEISALAISAENVTALADGSELTLKIGNPSSATITELKFKAKWGPVDKNDAMIDAEAKEADKSITVELPGGSWKTVKLALPGIPPSKLGLVTLKNASVHQMKMIPL